MLLFLCLYKTVHDWVYESDRFGGAHMQHMRCHSSYPVERVDITYLELQAKNNTAEITVFLES